MSRLSEPFSRLNARNMLNFERYRKPKEPVHELSGLGSCT